MLLAPRAPQGERGRDYEYATDGFDSVLHRSPDVVKSGDERGPGAEDQHQAAGEIDDEHPNAETPQAAGARPAGQPQRGDDRGRIDRIGDRDRRDEHRQPEHRYARLSAAISAESVIDTEVVGQLAHLLLVLAGADESDSDTLAARPSGSSI